MEADFGFTLPGLSDVDIDLHRQLTSLSSSRSLSELGGPLAGVVPCCTSTDDFITERDYLHSYVTS